MFNRKPWEMHGQIFGFPIVISVFWGCTFQETKIDHLSKTKMAFQARSVEGILLGHGILVNTPLDDF